MPVPADADASSPHPPWDDLATKLSTDSLQVTETDNLLDDWLDQCVHPFADLNLTYYGGTDYPVSNHQLYNETSGLCMVHVFCAYKECNAGRFTRAYSGISVYNSTLLTDDIWKNPEKKNWNSLDLPAAVVHPRHVGDISAAIMFANQHNIQLSVKTSGHSYTGASTKDNSLLLNLFRLKQYAHPELEYTDISEEDHSDTNNGVSSIVECQYDTLDSSTQDGYKEACALAIARSKTAVIRVGGGETWDLVLKAVSETWNNDPTKSRKYNIISGAAGTVSAAGGWLASGGLSGNNGMRMHGLGVDQVLHVEMVLPEGMHVRFGPTVWDSKAGMMYPHTKAVTGYCNKGDLEDESAWDWQECDEDISFMDLWYAVRGGGGGSYGVITAIYYQLHEYSKLQLVLDPTSVVFDLIEKGLLSVEDGGGLLVLWYDFFLKFFFDPAEVGVTKEASNSCSGASSGPLFFCFNDGSDVMIAAWERFCKAAGFDDAIQLLNTLEEFDSWFHYLVDQRETNPNVPPGRGIDDGPLPTIPSSLATYPDYTNQFLMFPQDALVNKRDELVPMLLECVLRKKCLHSFYIMGGNIPDADDGHNSLPIHRRNGGFLMAVFDNDYRTKFNQIFYGVEDGQAMTGDDFPGALCHNHAGLDYPTPRKDDWTKACDLSYSKDEKEEKCFSFQETAWGTQVLKKLERIHADVDPNRLFSTSDSAGYDDGKLPNGTVLTTSLIACVTSVVTIALAALWT